MGNMPPAPLGPPVPVGFSPIDWIIVASYLALVIVIGIMVGRRRTGVDDYFLAGRSMPMWAVAISILATSQSAATFVGGPEQSYTGNLTYFLANLGGLIAVVIVALLFLPAFYRHGVTSIYELLGHRFGGAAQKCAGAMFLIGRVFASGARLFIVALPFSMVAFGDTSYQSLLISIAIIAIGPHSTSKTLAPRLERMVTVAVDTAQAQKLALAQEVGRLSLILRVRGIGPPGDPYSDPSTRPFRDLNEPFNPVIRRGIRLFEIGPERE